MNIPIYRAKEIDSDEYVEGYLLSSNGNEMIRDTFMNIHIVSSSTIAIHFPDMLDSQGNKIFASLSEDGKGGDIIKGNRPTTRLTWEGVAHYFKKSRIVLNGKDLPRHKELKYYLQWKESKFKVIGIQK
jgi:hypothetical protein